MNSSLLMRSALAVLSVAHIALGADPVFAPGVTLESGWFDTNKAYRPAAFYQFPEGATTAQNDWTSTANVFANEDATMCWAATSTNILLNLRYQLGYEVEYSTTWKAALESGKNSYYINQVQNRQQYAIYETYITNFSDSGGYDPFNGIAWYTTGSLCDPYLGGTHSSLKTDNKGFYSAQLGGTDAYTYVNKVEACHYYLHVGNYAGTRLEASADGLSLGNKSTNYAALFEEALKTSAIGLNLANKDTILAVNDNGNSAVSGTHSLTCWGFETGDDGEINMLYITDSDDGLTHLMKVEAAVNEDGILTLGAVKNRTYTGAYDVDGNSAKAIFQSPTTYSSYGVYEFGSFQNFFALIPEPSTAALSLLGLGSLLLRRKRD